MTDDGLTPEEALRLAKTVADLYADTTTRLLATIARATARGIDRPDWAVAALGRTLVLRQQARTVLAEAHTLTAAETVAQLRVAYTGGTGGLVSVDQRAVLALAADTERLTTALGAPVLRWADDTYRATVAAAAGPAVAGATARREAAAAALARFATIGVTGFTDAAGRAWALDSYAEMATRTALGRAHTAGTLARFAEQGRTHVVVSDSPEECPQCRPFEGKVLSLGADAPPADLGGMAYAGTLAGAMARGLLHPNCTHRLGAYVPGLTRPFGDTANPDGYVLRQQQRTLERRVRESKRRVAALEPLGGTTHLTRQRQLLADRRARLNGFNADHDRKAYVSRARVEARR